MDRSFKRLVYLVLAALLDTSRGAHAASVACLDYEPAVVTLSGKISSHLEYGSPNFGEDPKTDEKLWYWYLDLDAPICVNAKEQFYDSAENSIYRLQIVFIGKYPPGRRQQWVGHRVSIAGTLYHSDNGHHFTPVLIKAERTTLVRTGRSVLSRPESVKILGE